MILDNILKIGSAEMVSVLIPKNIYIYSIIMQHVHWIKKMLLVVCSIWIWIYLMFLFRHWNGIWFEMLDLEGICHCGVWLPDITKAKHDVISECIHYIYIQSKKMVCPASLLSHFSKIADFANVLGRWVCPSERGLIMINPETLQVQR